MDKLKNKVIVDHHGNVTWLSLGILSGKCSMDITYFPFDEQHCSMKFGLWSYHGLLVDLKPTKDYVDLGNV